VAISNRSLFLFELAQLLKKYSAELYPNQCGEGICAETQLEGLEPATVEGRFIASNVMEYAKKTMREDAAHVGMAVPADFAIPDWSSIKPSQDWKRYVTAEVRDLWLDLPFEAKAALAGAANLRTRSELG
jgi:hypothetical protein